MLITGENIDDIDMVSSSAESSKERGKTKEVETETSINTKNKRKGKKIAEASTTKGGKKKKVPSAWDHFKTIEGDKEYVECIYCARKISCASANGTNAMKRHIARCKKAPFNLEKTQTILDFESKTKCNADGTIETEATLSFSGSRYATGNHFVEEIFDIGHKLRYVEWIVRRSYDPSNSFVLCQRIKDTLTSLFDLYASSQPSAPQIKSRSMDDVGHGDGGIRKLKGTNLRKDFVTEVELFDTSETTELEKYLGDKCVHECDDFDILSWWSMQTMNLDWFSSCWCLGIAQNSYIQEVIFSSLLQLSRGITDVDDRKQKEICAAKFKKRDEMSKGKLFEINLEGEEECEICMEMHSKIVLSNCNAGEGGDAGL
ncbi:hypothetical protein V6N11_002160 [Hibiscus sabdariffa]|uniref:BED-type domain-containing protein n=1 Tax=Hibiscus sabdariffa TaxID=183260 RepID=A0ABR2QUT2_9ROSI